MALITLNEYKSLMGVQSGDTRNDAQVTALLAAASKAIESYVGRKFDTPPSVATARSFQYDGSGMLDIDDCTTVTSVVTDAGISGQSIALQTYEWTLMPQDDSDSFYYLLIHGGPYFGVSPEMGFERNLDNYAWWGSLPLMTVTATWGWPAVPDDVKLATALTVHQLVENKNTSEGLSAEAIEGWSRAWGGRSGSVTAALAVPNRARDLLVRYQRIFV